ncbi:MAG: TlpA family protein disulfide reductase [Bryobacteraceae bacterium]
MLGSGVQASSFELPDLDSKSRSLGEMMADGKPLLLVFFKVSCPVCQLVFPFLERMASGGGELRFVAISQDDAAATRNFHQRFGVTFPTLLDRARAGYPVSNAFQITNVPSLFLIEPDGAISLAISGFSRRDLEALGKRSGAQPFRPGEQVPEWKAG